MSSGFGVKSASAARRARIVHQCAGRAGLDTSAYGTHSLCRTKPAQIYKKAGNVRAVQLLLGPQSWEVRSAIAGLKWITPSAARSRSSYRR